MALTANLHSFCIESAVNKKMIRELAFQVMLHAIFVAAIACFIFSSFKRFSSMGSSLLNEGTGFLLLLVLVALMVFMNLIMLYKESQKIQASSRRKFLLIFWSVVLCIAFIILALLLFQIYGFRLSSNKDIRDVIPSFREDVGTLISPDWSDHKHTTLFVSVGPVALDPFHFGLNKWIGLKVVSDQIISLYSREIFAGSCRTTDRQFCPVQGGQPACAVETQLHKPSTQVCVGARRGNGRAYCQLRPPPQTLLGFFQRDWELVLLRKIHQRISAEGSLVCKDSCRFKNDGACDDGGFRAQYHVCEFGSDCKDCNARSWYYETMKTKFYPTCGWVPASMGAAEGFVRWDDIPNFEDFPQRYYAKWLEGKWFLNHTIPLGNFGNERMCLRACLLENFVAQETCKFIQFNRKSGVCEAVVGYSKWCTWTNGRVECPHLLFASSNEKVTHNPPRPYDSLTARARGNNWEKVDTLPTRESFRREAHGRVYVLAEQVYTGMLPDELKGNRDISVALMPFYAFPGLLGALFLYELCYKVPSAENPIRFTDSEFPFNWYLFMQSAFCSQLSRASNLKMLLLGYTVAVWTSLILPRLVTAGSKISKNAWAISLIPVYMCCLVIVLGTVGLFRMVCSDAHSVLFTVDDRVYHYRTLALFLCLLVPCTLCLCFWNYFVGDNSEGSIDLYLLPFLIGFALHVVLLLIYSGYYLSSAMQRYKDGNLEQVEIEARAKLREETACKVDELKAEFFKNSTSSERLVEIMQTLVFHKSMLVSRQELLELGSAKLAILEGSDDPDMIRKCWTRDVAKVYGQALVHVTTPYAVGSGYASPTSLRRVTFSDLDISDFQAPYMVALRRKKLRLLVEEYLRDTTSLCFDDDIKQEP